MRSRGWRRAMNNSAAEPMMMTSAVPSALLGLYLYLGPGLPGRLGAVDRDDLLQFGALTVWPLFLIALGIGTADAMLARLSDLLRLSLDRISTQQVTLKEEMDFLQKYLEIERTRFGDRLDVRFDVEAETLDASVPTPRCHPSA